MSGLITQVPGVTEVEGKRFDYANWRTEQRFSHSKEVLDIVTGDGHTYTFSRHGEDEPLTFEKHVDDDFEPRGATSKLPAAVNFVAKALGGNWIR